jgi:hypothetical protein
MGLFDEEKAATHKELDAEELERERDSSANRLVVVGTLVLSFLVGLVVADIDKNSILDPNIQRPFAALGTATGTLLIAGIPSAFAAKYTKKWRFVWLGITVLLLTSQIIVFASKSIK